MIYYGSWDYGIMGDIVFFLSGFCYSSGNIVYTIFKAWKITWYICIDLRIGNLYSDQDFCYYFMQDFVQISYPHGTW